MTSPVDDITDLYQRWGHDHYDEAITQIAHGLQCAALAVRDGADDALVAAALLHDIGHLLAVDSGRPFDGTDDVHEAVGARYLARVFPPSVTGPIALHVQAKRYRCAVEPEYLASLSAASVRSLAVQGGPMTPTESEAFGARPDAARAVALRGWDDEGKVDGLDVPGWDAYVDLLRKAANTNA